MVGVPLSAISMNVDITKDDNESHGPEADDNFGAKSNGPETAKSLGAKQYLAEVNDSDDDDSLCAPIDIEDNRKSKFEMARIEQSKSQRR